MPITDRLLLGPGPSNPYPEAVAALGRPLLGHMDPEFLAILDETMARLRTVFRTDQRADAPDQRHRLGGHGGVLRQPARAGRHRDRRRQRRVRRPHVRGRAPLRRRGRARRGGVGAAARSAAPARRATRAPRRPPRRGRARGDVDRRRERHRAARRAARHRHAAARRHRHVARRHPGRDRRLGRRRQLLGHAEVPRRAARALAGHVLARGPSSACRPARTPPQSWYLDLSLIANYVDGASRVYHHTAPVSMVFALHAALGALLDEGLEAAWARHRAVGDPAPGARCPSSGSASSCPRATASPSSPPRGCPTAPTTRRCARRCSTTYGIEVGGGLGRVRGQGVAHRAHGPLRARALGDHAPRRAARAARLSRAVRRRVAVGAVAACARGSSAARRSTRARRRAPGASPPCAAASCTPRGTSAGTAP